MTTIALFGASYANKTAPYDSAFKGGAFRNGDYLDMGTELSRNGFLVNNYAQGGAYSENVPNTGWIGIIEQVQRALEGISPLWPDPVKVGVFSLLNDHIHGFTAPPDDGEQFLQRVYTAAEMWHNAGKEVIITALPEWESVDLQRAIRFYFPEELFPDYWIADEAHYRLLQNKQFVKFGAVPWINFAYPWKKAGIAGDGLHFDSGDMKKGTDVVVKEIKRLV